MDTRAKIVHAGGAAPQLPAGTRVVSGFFDPLLSWHAERLAEARAGASALAVVVRDPTAPLLSTGARAELVAALRCVDYVFAGPAHAPAPHFELDVEDRSRAAAFAGDVRARQK